jgi:hypothetical protein
MNHADLPMLGRQWVMHLPKEKQLKIEKVSGDLKLGGTLAGRVTGGKRSDGLPYSWEIEFALPLPAKSAASGPLLRCTMMEETPRAPASPLKLRHLKSAAEPNERILEGGCS